MNTNVALSGLTVLALAVAGPGIAISSQAWGHCDTMSGPVVTDAKKAIESEKVGLVLKWVRPENEDEIRSLFEKTLKTRKKGNDVQELVDMHFFETLVRLHRAAEGAPYTGLKPAGAPVEPGIEAAEKALDTESDSAIIEALQAQLESGIHGRFERTVETRKHKDENVAAGREYVEAYVDYIHYVERLYLALSGIAADGHEAEADRHAEPSAPESGESHKH